MDQTTPTLGKLLGPNEHRRDAIHICLAPVTAAEDMIRGERVCFAEPGNAEFVRRARGPDDDVVGISDPFLRQVLKKGDRFWLFVLPGTITALRHIWTHPSFVQAYREGQKDE